MGAFTLWMVGVVISGAIGGASASADDAIAFEFAIVREADGTYVRIWNLIGAEPLSCVWQARAFAPGIAGGTRVSGRAELPRASESSTGNPSYSAKAGNLGSSTRITDLRVNCTTVARTEGRGRRRRMIPARVVEGRERGSASRPAVATGSPLGERGGPEAGKAN
jgi:hypothetical protein